MESAGFNRLMDKLHRLDAVASQRVLASAAKKALVPVLEDAQARAPKQTGLLAKGLTIRGGKATGGASVAAAGITPTGPHRSFWHLAEFGTSKQPARPYLRPAMRANVQKSIDIFREELRRAIERALKRQEAETFTFQAKQLGATLAKRGGRLAKKAGRLQRKSKKAAGRLQRTASKAAG